MVGSELLEFIAKTCTQTEDPEALPRVVQLIAKVYNVSSTEVAVLQLAEGILSFVVPAKLRNVGTIPLSAATTSVAARTALNKRAEVINNFQSTRHASVFEGVKLEDGHRLPIRKLMSAPVMRDGECRGVLQVSRKAASEGKVPDFSSDDLMALSQIARHVSNLI